MTNEQIEVLTTDSLRWNEFTEALGQIVFPGENILNCNHDHRHAKQVMSEMGGVDIPASIEYFEEHGGFCDCEILFNVLH
jgi:hypothetical protein